MATTVERTMPSETWPTGDDYTRALALLSASCHAIDLLDGRLSRLVDHKRSPALNEGQPDPDIRDLGNLKVFVERARLDLQTMMRTVEDAEAKVSEVALDEDWLESSLSLEDAARDALAEWVNVQSPSNAKPPAPEFVDDATLQA